MSDRELLEAAARAAGYRLGEPTGADDGSYNVYEPDGTHDHWNPLTDDADALRLAVKLGLRLDLRWQTNEVTVYGASRVDEGVRGDPYAATRRAIVRAAAAMAEGAG